MKEHYFHIYGPSSKMPFGKYEGEDLKFIYVFDPSYLDWLVIKNRNIMLRLSDFKFIHTSQIPFINKLAPKGIVNFKGENFKLRDYLERHTDLMKHYLTEPEYGHNYYIFSEKALNILKHGERLLEARDPLKNKYPDGAYVRYCTEDYPGEFEDLERLEDYEASVADEIARNAEMNDRMLDFIKECNKDYYDEFDGFYHEDME